MRENGTLRYKNAGCNTTEQVYDEYGNPVEASVSWGAAFPCLVKTITDNRKAQYVDGEYRALSFEILIETANDFCNCSNSVMLTRKGECLGEFRIISKEALPTVGRVRIFV